MTVKESINGDLRLHNPYAELWETIGHSLNFT